MTTTIKTKVQEYQILGLLRQCGNYREKFIQQKNLYDLKQLSGEFGRVTDRLKVFPVMAKQYHPYTGAPLSATPLAWSHSIFVETVLAYISRMEDFVKKNLFV